MASKPVTDKEIGALIRAMRIKKGIGQPELGVALGVSSMMVQHYETGRSSLTILKLLTIAETLGCKPVDLIPQ